MSIKLLPPPCGRQPPQLPDHGQHAEDADGAEVGLHEQASHREHPRVPGRDDLGHSCDE